MASIFRTIWHKPKIHDAHIERKVSWLELFYDLVYVVAVAQLAHHLAAHPTLESLGQFLFLFLPIFFAWQNGAYYHDYYETYDISIRVFTFIQLLAVVGMAIHAHNALGEGSTGFALSYIVHHLFLTILWWRTGLHDDEDGVIGRLQKPWLICYSISIIIFIASLFVEAPLRFYMWGIALFFDLAAPTVAALSYKNLFDRPQKTSDKLQERFGLFTILVLGESFAGVVNGMSGIHHPSGHLQLLLVGATLLAFLLWWVYFDTVASREVRSGMWRHDLWMYCHLAIYMSLTAVGAGILDLLSNAENYHSGWLMLGGTGVFLFVLGTIDRALENYKGLDRRIHRNDGMLKGIFGILLICLAIFTHDVSPSFVIIVLLTALALISLHNVINWLRWRRRLDSEVAAA